MDDGVTIVTKTDLRGCITYVNPDFIANAAGSPGGKWLKVSMEKNGTFTVSNRGDTLTKTYKPRK